jgi:putative transposase
MLNAEMDHHLGTEAEEEAGNHRNGYSGKSVLTDTGKLELAIPQNSSNGKASGSCSGTVQTD